MVLGNSHLGFINPRGFIKDWLKNVPFLYVFDMFLYVFDSFPICFHMILYVFEYVICIFCTFINPRWLLHQKTD